MVTQFYVNKTVGVVVWTLQFQRTLSGNQLNESF